MVQPHLEMRARIKMMPKMGNKTLADQMFEYEFATGKPADQDTIDRIAKVRMTSGDAVVRSEMVWRVGRTTSSPKRDGLCKWDA